MSEIAGKTLPTSFQAPTCGDEELADWVYPVRIELPDHTANSITLRFTTNLDQSATNEFFGIADVLVQPYERTWPATDTFESVSGCSVRETGFSTYPDDPVPLSTELKGRGRMDVQRCQSGHYGMRHLWQHSWCVGGEESLFWFCQHPYFLYHFFPNSLFAMRPGGYNILGKGARISKTYRHLPDHKGKEVVCARVTHFVRSHRFIPRQGLTIQMDAYFIDSWDNEIYMVYVDDMLAFSKNSRNVQEGSGGQV